MKRIGNLYQKISSLENLYLADQKARKGKSHQPAVKAHLLNWEANLYSLHHALRTKAYRTSPYTTFKVYEPKERDVFRLPYFPDRITHHAIMNVLEPIFGRLFTADSFSCIKGRGIHGAASAVRRALMDVAGTQYCLKLDVRKFYPSISHNILKGMLARKFKDPGEILGHPDNLTKNKHMTDEYLLKQLLERVAKMRQSQRKYYAHRAPKEDPLKRSYLQEAQRREEDLDKLVTLIAANRPDLLASPTTPGS